MFIFWLYLADFHSVLAMAELLQSPPGIPSLSQLHICVMQCISSGEAEDFFNINGRTVKLPHPGMTSSNITLYSGDSGCNWALEVH